MELSNSILLLFFYFILNTIGRRSTWIMAFIYHIGNFSKKRKNSWIFKASWKTFQKPHAYSISSIIWNIFYLNLVFIHKKVFFFMCVKMLKVPKLFEGFFFSFKPNIRNFIYSFMQINTSQICIKMFVILIDM